MNYHAETTSTLFLESLHRYSNGAPVKAFKPTPVNPDYII